MAYWRVGVFPSLASYLRGHHDDSTPGAVKYRNTSRDSRFDRFSLSCCRLLATSFSGIARSCEDYTKKKSTSHGLQPRFILTRSFEWLLIAPYLLACDWCTYDSQMCMVGADGVSGRFKEEQ